MLTKKTFIFCQHLYDRGVNKYNNNILFVVLDFNQKHNTLLLLIFIISNTEFNII